MAIAVVTGYTTHAGLLQASFAPLIALRRAGVLERLVYVTWDDAGIDGHVAAVRDWPEAELIRIPRPVLTGAAYRTGFTYQNRTLAAGLAEISDADTLVVKSRPDFIFDRDLLAGKIASFAHWRRPADFSHYVTVAMPPSPFAGRLWVPWATANLPFYIEDAAFIGLKRDLEKLATPEAEQMMALCEGEDTPLLAHCLRFLVPFLRSYPIFTRMLDSFHLFAMAPHYRRQFLDLALADAFFWHLLVAQAWILATCFHIDCGRQGQLRLVPSRTAEEYAGRPVGEIPDNMPYRDVEAWRQVQRPGTMLSLLMRMCARLVDEDWLQALFSAPVQSGCTHDDLLRLLANVADYRSGLLTDLEDAYYDKAEALFRAAMHR